MDGEKIRERMNAEMDQQINKHIYTRGYFVPDRPTINQTPESSCVHSSSFQNERTLEHVL